MDAEFAGSADAATRALLADLDNAAALLAELAGDAQNPDRKERITAARVVVVQARRTLESQNETMRAFATGVQDLSRQLIESHARFGEWMSQPPPDLADSTAGCPCE